MHLKDYYKILAIEPSATLAEIKQAYRRLALQYHPDKTNNDPYAASYFTEIKEAYEVLTNPTKKAYYLQQRWYDQSLGKRQTQHIITPVSVLKQALELDRYVSRLDTFRMDKQGLYEYINSMLDSEVMNTLKKFNEPSVTEQLIATLLKIIATLSSAHVSNITRKLNELAGDNMRMKQLITQSATRAQHNERWEKRMPIFILLITFIICILIWLSIK